MAAEALATLRVPMVQRVVISAHRQIVYRRLYNACHSHTNNITERALAIQCCMPLRQTGNLK